MKMRSFIFFLLIGVTLGMAQVFFVRDVTYTRVEIIRDGYCTALSPGCGYCPLEDTYGDECRTNFTQTRRGFPLTVGPQGALSPNISGAIYLNIAILALGVPVFAYVVSSISERIYKTLYKN